MSEATAAPEQSLVATGIAGFDDIIGGGFTRNRLYLIQGNPGSGKTTLALQFLLEGARLGETPPAIPHHRVDGFPDGEVPPCRVVVGGVVADVTTAECVDQARDQAEMVQQWAPGRGVVGQHHRRGW